MIMLIATTEEGDKAQEGLAEMLKNDLSTNKRKFLDYIFEEEGSLARRDAASYIVASTGACCDSRSALKTLCSHFQKHPAGVLPLFWQIRTSEKTFQCAVLLPPSAPANIRCQISDPVTRKSDAKALVALECVRQLHLAGELDDTLRSPYGLAIPTPAALSAGQEEDEGVDKNIEIKYVPDCLLNSSARMFMYAIHVSHSFEVYNQSRIPTLLTELGNAGLCFPSPLPQGTDAFQLSYRNAVAVDVRLVFLCEREISGEELICMQKFHRALLCWESNGPTPQMQRSGEWDKSSNGANYIMFPLSAEFKYSDGWRNSSHGFKKSWLSFLRTSADAAEDLIKNFFINKKISSTECSPIGFTLGANAYRFSGRLISHLPGFFSYALEEHEISLHSLLHFEKKKEPKRYFDFFLEKDYVCAESLNAMFNKSNHRLVTSIGVGCRLTAESLISSPELMAVDVNHSSKPAHLIPEYCQVVGSLEYYLLGIGLPSLIWRIQSLLLAHECLEHIKSLYTQILSLESRSDTPLQELLFPSPILMLEALTPRLCQENINCERIEMLGDSILKLIIGHELFTMYPEKQEGELTSMRSRIGTQ